MSNTKCTTYKMYNISGSFLFWRLEASHLHLKKYMYVHYSFITLPAVTIPLLIIMLWREGYTISTHINLQSWLNHQYSKIWINLHFFGPKVHFLRVLEAFMSKIFNKPPPWNPNILINLRRFICVGTVHTNIFLFENQFHEKSKI